MASITANNITLEFDTFGSDSHEPLLLVMGLGAQMTAWDEDFCQQLADRDHFVIRYDNRDVGLSTYFDDHGEPSIEALVADRMAGKEPNVPYHLDDMAADGMALLDELGIDDAHICGASLGGMIVQTMAINHPDRVRSVTSIMSTTGNPELPPASPEAMAALSSERKDDPDHAMDRAVKVNEVIGSPGFPRDIERIRRRALETYRRAYYPQGVSRQMAAIIAHGDRREGLRKLNMPALVIHGDADPLVPLTGGIDTHENIPGADLLVIEGMGHDMPMGSWSSIIEAISKLTKAQAN